MNIVITILLILFWIYIVSAVITFVFEGIINYADGARGWQLLRGVSSISIIPGINTMIACIAIVLQVAHLITCIEEWYLRRKHNKK